METYYNVFYLYIVLKAPISAKLLSILLLMLQCGTTFDN